MEMLTRIWTCCTTDYGIYMTIGKVFPTNCLANHLGCYVSSVVYNPGLSLVVITVVHLVIGIIVFPFHLISYIISVPGAWLLWIGSIICLCRFFARIMMFPGYLLPVQRSVAKEILRGITQQNGITSHSFASCRRNCCSSKQIGSIDSRACYKHSCDLKEW